MTLQQFVRFDKYVRCFTFGKNDIVPVAYDPHERQYIVDHDYLSPALGERIVKDAQTINQALGYEMNTIEFGVEDGVPYAIDFLNPAPDFERDRITPHYFDLVARPDVEAGHRSRAERPADATRGRSGSRCSAGARRPGSSASRGSDR